MPCYDHRDSSSYKEDQLRERNDMLARIACKAMNLLEELGKEDFLLIKDKEVRDWWMEHKVLDAEYMQNKKKRQK